MKFIISIFFAFVLVCSCTNKNAKIKEVNKTLVKSETDSIIKEDVEQNPCQVTYDTITNEKYFMHKVILDKSQKGWKGNPIWFQDICEFLRKMDPSEKGSYKFLTNKVVFKILEYSPNNLAISLTHPTIPEENLNYFFDIASKPTCADISIDSLTLIVEKGFSLNLYSEKNNVKAKELKKELINRLKVDYKSK